MSLEFRPAGVGCNLQCRYCYQTSTRELSAPMRYDKAKTWHALETAGQYWSLFGGEALLIPLKDLEELLELGHRRFKQTGLQTNGSLITPRHIELFERYNTHVGISMDGPGEMNDIRWAGTLEATRSATAKSEWAVAELAGRAKTTPSLLPSMIVTLHAGNIGTEERSDRLIRWFYDLDALGLKSINLHAMELDHLASDWIVSTERALEFMIRLWNESAHFTNLKFTTFKEILQLLRGHDNDACCTWHACDPWNTAAVQGLEGDGSPSHCTRTNKDGKTWLPASGSGRPTKHAIGAFPGNRFHERQLSLYVTPQEHGGCLDCRFWLMCQGQCPGTGTMTVAEPEGDWRVRSSHCELWKGLFEEGERRLKSVHGSPVSLRLDRLEIEARMYAAWESGGGMQLHSALSSPQSVDATNIPSHGDSAGQGAYHVDHGDTLHADAHGDAHGDSHGDSNTPEGDHPHGDAHGDSPHGDSNTPEGDHPHGDAHGDSPHNDNHGDSSGGDE